MESTEHLLSQRRTGDRADREAKRPSSRSAHRLGCPVVATTWIREMRSGVGSATDVALVPRADGEVMTITVAATNPMGSGVHDISTTTLQVTLGNELSGRGDLR